MLPTQRTAIACLSVLLGACAKAPSLKSTFNQYQNLELEKADPFPVEADPASPHSELKKGKTQVALKIRPGQTFAKETAATVGVTQYLERYLLDVGSAIPDANLIELFDQDVRTARAGRKHASENAVGVRYGLFGEFTVADLRGKYTAPEIKRSPPLAGICTYSLDTELQLRIYEKQRGVTPYLAKTLVLRNLYEEQRKAEKPHCKLAPVDRKRLMRDSIEASMPCTREPIQEHFSPSGYVIEARALGDKHIFQFSAGSINGVNAGDRVTVERLYRSSDATINVTSTYNTVVEARVSDIVEPYAAWAVPDGGKAYNIKRGDRVKVLVDKGWLNKISCGAELEVF